MTTPGTPTNLPRRQVKGVWLRGAQLVLGLAAIGAAYLAWYSLGNGAIAGCGPISNCDAVLHSRWAYWLDIPVSLPALLCYLTLILATVLLPARVSADEQRGLWSGIIILSVVILGAGLWFIGLQWLIIKAFCPFCMTVHACGMVAASLFLTHVPVSSDPETPMWASDPNKHGVPIKGLISLIFIGLMGLATLTAGQLFVIKKSNVVKVTSSGQVPNSDATTNDASNSSSAQIRLLGTNNLSLYGGKFNLQINQLPIIGTPSAKHFILCLYDYACPHCRVMHPALIQSQQRLSNILGIILLPVGTSTNCNMFMSKMLPSNSNSCEFARLALAVWRANPEAFPQFDGWLLDGALPSVAHARELAAQIVGQERLATTLQEPWITQQLHENCRLHWTNSLVAGEPVLPQLMIGDAVSLGEISSVSHLMLLLEQHLKITRPR